MGFALAGLSDAAAAGPALRVGNGPPARSVGRVDDLYLDRSDGRIFGPRSAAGDWGTGFALRALGVEAPRGTPDVASGVGPPAPDLGSDGSWFVRTDTAEIYGPRRFGDWGLPKALSGRTLASSEYVHRMLAAEPEQLFARSTAWQHGAVAAADVRWPDGTPGHFEVLEWSDRFPGTIDSFAVTYGDPSIRRYVQPAVVRDARTGAVRHRPALTAQI